jgi:hypothetical protein
MSGPAPAGHGLAGAADAGAFLARLTRLDSGAAVRLRSAGDRTELWARLPWDVLVTRLVDGPGPGDATLSAAQLLTELARGGSALPPRRDDQWRWPLPPTDGRLVETVAVAELHRLADAAAGALREAATAGVAGRPVGQRALRDALLDHVALTVTLEDDASVRVPQRLVQAVWRMGFLGSGGPSGGAAGGSDAGIRLAGRWIGISAPFGRAWLPSPSILTVIPAGNHPNG